MSFESEGFTPGPDSRGGSAKRKFPFKHPTPSVASSSLSDTTPYMPDYVGESLSLENPCEDVDVSPASPNDLSPRPGCSHFSNTPLRHPTNAGDNTSTETPHGITSNKVTATSSGDGRNISNETPAARGPSNQGLGRSGGAYRALQFPSKSHCYSKGPFDKETPCFSLETPGSVKLSAPGPCAKQNEFATPSKSTRLCAGSASKFSRQGTSTSQNSTIRGTSGSSTSNRPGTKSVNSNTRISGSDSFSTSFGENIRGTTSSYFSKRTNRSSSSTPSSYGRQQRTGIPRRSATVTSASTSSETTDGTDGEMTENDVSRVRDRETSDFDDSQVYMGILWHAGKLGVAFYDADSTQIHVMLDAPETDDFKLLLRVIKQVKPSQIILSAKQDERLLRQLKTQVSRNVDQEAGGLDNLWQALPSIDFSLEITKRRVLGMQLTCIPSHYSDAERTIYMTSLIPFENVTMIRALGGLLKYLEKMRVGIELEEAGVRVPVLAVNIFTLESQMILDDTAYSALQIFQRESHPSVYKSGTGNSGKEGLSLFGIMNRTKSQLGSRMLRTWFLRPLKDVEMIRQRHEAITYFTHPRNIEVVSSLEDSVKHMKNISKILSRMTQSQASVGDWQALYKTVFNACNIKEVCRAQPQTIELFKKITRKFTDDLHKITTFITKIIDFQDSMLRGRFVVKPNLDAELDKKKQLLGGLPGFMTQVADQEMEKFSGDITECSVLYIPQVGYLLAIAETAVKSHVPVEAEHCHIEGLQFLFSSNNVLHYRSARTRELDSLLGDVRCDITDMETSIMHKLQNIILEHSAMLMAVLDCTAQLDCLLSLAACAREYGYVRPTLTLDNVLQVTAGRHPIQEMCCGTFVPNDIVSNAEYGKIKVLTGPNACGKSVYIKQVALIVFLAQIGSFVPAESATLGLVDRIFTRVRSLESVSIGLSTFMIDINQMAEALRNATERSVCIVDEFGKGTDMVDGLALLSSSLGYWVGRESCPHVYVSTHFHSVIQQHLLPRTPQIKYLTLETLHNGEELVFLYQLIEGHTSCSYACHVASQLGLPRDIVKRGIQASELVRQCRPVQPVDTGDSQLTRCSMVVNKFLQLDMDTADVKHFLTEFVVPAMEGRTQTVGEQNVAVSDRQ